MIAQNPFPIRWILLVVLGGFASAQVFAETPGKLPGGKVVSALEVHRLIKQPKVMVFDQRNAVNYGRGHLPGAVYLAYEAKKPIRAYLHKLPRDKNTPIVFYSRKATWWKSQKVADIAIKAGYRNVYWYPSGYSEWTREGLPVEK